MKRSITLTTVFLVSLFLFTHAVKAQPTPTPVLPEGYDWKFNPDNGHYYTYVNELKIWIDAVSYCQNHGGYLFTVTSETEQQWINLTFLPILDGEISWMGLGEIPGETTRGWITGEPFEYTNWSNIEPNTAYLPSYFYKGYWADQVETRKYGFIMEFDGSTPYIPPTPTPTPTLTPTPEIWSSLNGETLEDNYLTAGAPAGYTQGRIKLGEIPEGEGSDGIGMEIKLAPGQGVFIASFKEFEMPSLVHLSGSFRADNKDVAIALVGLNSPIDGQIGYTNVRGDEIPVNDYRKFNLVFAPPSGNVQYAIQAVNSPFSTISSTVWVDNIEVKSYAPIVDFEPVVLEVNGNFEGGLESLMVNINDDDGTVIPFFETITDIALRMSIEPSNIAANIGTTCQGIYDQFPFSLLGQVSVKRESMPGGGMMALVLTNGFQNLGIFRFADQIKTINDVQDEMLIIGGDFNTNNPDIPISAFVQLGGPGADVSVVVDDLVVYKDGVSVALNPSSITPTNTPASISTPTPTSTPTPDNPSELTVLLPGNVPLELVRIPAGTFMMGSESGDSDEKPVHEVTISKDFYLGKYEVTQAQWQAVMGSNPSHFGGNNLPVDSVSWNDCEKFITKLNQMYHGTFRLPTEAEWEYACRAGTTTDYYWENGNIGDYAWYSSHSGSNIYTQEVGTKLPNEFGLYDMSGNVWEWCQDWYDSNYYSNSPNIDPVGADSGSKRVFRGGSWYNDVGDWRSANRSYNDPVIWNIYYGVRVSKTQ